MQPAEVAAVRAALSPAQAQNASTHLQNQKLLWPVVVHFKRKKFNIFSGLLFCLTQDYWNLAVAPEALALTRVKKPWLPPGANHG